MQSFQGVFAGHLTLVHKGKVRETYEVPGRPDLLLVVATDRVSTHNMVHQSIVSDKGAVLTALTVHWLTEIFKDLPHHLVAAGQEIYRYIPLRLREEVPNLESRAIIVRKLDMVFVEFILRRYMVGKGSLYRAYVDGYDPYGLRLPKGLPVMHRFDEPVFTPTDKSEEDRPLYREVVEKECPEASDLAKRLFELGEEHLASCGIALLDSKFEVGYSPKRQIAIADEILTPDSSRFADLEQVREGQDPSWLDKQLLRDAAESKWTGGEKYPVCFSQDVLDQTCRTMGSILHRVSGTSLSQWRQGKRFDFHI